MRYVCEVAKCDNFVTVWNFSNETVFAGFINEVVARYKSPSLIGMWKIKKLK